LASAFADHVRIGSAEALPGGAGRRSVRIQSSTAYNQGLFVAEIPHVPSGCGTWPAFWMYGEDAGHPWPVWGEYDIIEVVHGMRRTMTTLHTGPGCDQSGVGVARDFASSWDVGPSGSEVNNCDINAEDQFPNQGCAQLGPIDSAGANFNSAGGGTFAAEWDPLAQHIRTWFWPSGSEPADLAQKVPEPAGWGTPYSFFSLAQTCSPDHFVNMRLVFNLDFCGDLGERVFAEHCPEAAEGGKTCAEWVEQHPEKMLESFWTIRKLDVYQQATPGSVRNWVLAGLLFLVVGLVCLVGAAWAVDRRDLSLLPECGKNDYDEVSCYSSGDHSRSRGENSMHAERQLISDDLPDPHCSLGWFERVLTGLGMMRRRSVVTL